MVLLTGIKGFIGSRLVFELGKIYGFDNIVAMSSTKSELCKTVLYNNDFLVSPSDKELLKKVKIVIHAGAYTPKGRHEANNIDGCTGNIVFTQMLFNLLGSNLSRFIYLSTLDVYAPSDLITEKSNVEPQTLYGLSKLYCEKVVSTICTEKNINFQVLRIGHVYGPGEEKYKKIIPIAIQAALNDIEIEVWNNGEELRNFIYVFDVIR